MRIAFHFAIPEPRRPELDGAVQEALTLKRRYGGEIHFHYPAARFRRGLPAALCGARRPRRLAALDREVDLHHLFVARPAWLPLLWRWRKPIVLTLLAQPRGASGRRLPPAPRRVVVPCESWRDRLAARGVEGVEVVPPAVHGGRRAGPQVAPPPAPPFRLLAGSSPWTRRQIATKGFDLLLEAVAADPRLELVMLWRDTPAEEMRSRIRDTGIEDRVELLEGVADVPALLERIHAAVVLEGKPGLVKAFPQSLLEALQAGRPILASGSLEIARLAEARRCGVAVPALTREHLEKALERLAADYDELGAGAASLEPSLFSSERFVEAYGGVYRRLLTEASAPRREA